MLGLCLHSRYEGQPAILLEQAIGKNFDCPRSEPCYSVEILPGKILQIDWKIMVREIVRDIRDRTGTALISRKFHNAIVRAILRIAQHCRRQTGQNRVVLSGGCFMNFYLLENAVRLLREDGFQVFTHSLVPANDGGISLGQVAVANARLSDLD